MKRQLAALMAGVLLISSLNIPVWAEEVSENEVGIQEESAEALLELEEVSGIDDEILIEENDAEIISEDSISANETAAENESSVSGIENIANPRIVPDDTMCAKQKVTYDCIWFGSYPQAEVVPDKSKYTAIGADYLEAGDIIENASLYSQLQSATYNSKNETTIGGTRYRRMLKGDVTYGTSSSRDYYNWSDSITYHYFKYEPIKWRVIEKDSSTAFLLADKGIDAQRYNEEHTGVTWENCTLRNYLNSTFYDNAFNTAEKGMIIKSTVENADNLYSGTSGGNATNDNVFLLAEKEVYKTRESKSFLDSSAAVHGFADSYSTYDEARRARATVFSKAMGTYWFSSNPYKGNCWWWMRSPGYTSPYASSVHGSGFVYCGGDNVYYDNDAVRPALKIHLSSLTDSMYAGTVCSDGMVNETAKPGEGGGDTGDENPVDIIDIYPAADATNIAPGDNVVLTFGEDITPGNTYNDIRIREYETDKEVNTKSYILNNKLYVFPKEGYLDARTKYYVEIPENSVKTSNGYYVGAKDKELCFTTGSFKTAGTLDHETYAAFVTLAYELDSDGYGINDAPNDFDRICGMKITNLYGKEFVKWRERLGQKMEERINLGNSNIASADVNPSLHVSKKTLYDAKLSDWRLTDGAENIKDGFFAVVFTNIWTKQVVYVYGGSASLDIGDPVTIYKLLTNELKDWSTDDFPLYFKNDIDKQPKEALEFYDSTIDKYKGYDISVTGHSLGAALGTLISTCRNVKAITFNSVPMLDASYQRMPVEMSKQFYGVDRWRQTDIINTDDILAGVWEKKYKNRIECYNLNNDLSIAGLIHNHGIETIYTYSNDTFKIDEKGDKISPVSPWKKNMWLQELFLLEDIFDSSMAANDVKILAGLVMPRLSDVDNAREWLLLGDSKNEEINGISRLSGDKFKTQLNELISTYDPSSSYQILLDTVLPANNTIYAGEGDDKIYGHSGNDTIACGLGNDTADGAMGDDTYIYWKGQDKLSVIDCAGDDKICVYGINSGDKYGVEYKNGQNVVTINSVSVITIDKDRFLWNSIHVLFYDEHGKKIDDIEIPTDCLSNLKHIDQVSVACPVELQVFDKNGNLVKTINDESPSAQYESYGRFYNLPLDNGEYEKTATLFDDSYTVKTVVLNDGEMDCFIDDLSDDGNTTYYGALDKEIAEGDEFEVDFDKKEFVSEDESKSFKLGKGESTTPEEKPDGGEDAPPASNKITKNIDNTGYKVEYIPSVSYNGVSHIEKGGKTSASKAGDVEITLYDPTGAVISPSRYKVSFKNNKDTYGIKNKQPYFTIKLKDKVDKDIKNAFKNATMEFDINPCDMSKLNLSTPVIKETKNGYKVSKLQFTNETGKVIKLKQANAKGKGDFKVSEDSRGNLILEGIGNYTGKVKIKL